MGINARQVRGDSRSAELADKNVVEIAPPPEEIQEWADSHLISIYNVSPYPYRYEHPLVGVIVIPACEPGERVSEALTVKGMIPYGVRVEMKSAELRHESGRKFALDVLQLGPFMDKRQSLVHRGVFIASNNTFDHTRPEIWVKSGKCSDKPTEQEITAAEQLFTQTDFALIAEGDKHWGEGPTQPTTPHMGHSNISWPMREACERRGQIRPWLSTKETLIDCPGCGDKIKPGIIRHNCGAILDWDKALTHGMVTAEQHAAYKQSTKSK